MDIAPWILQRYRPLWLLCSCSNISDPLPGSRINGSPSSLTLCDVFDQNMVGVGRPDASQVSLKRSPLKPSLDSGGVLVKVGGTEGERTVVNSILVSISSSLSAYLSISVSSLFSILHSLSLSLFASLTHSLPSLSTFTTHL